MKPLQDPTDYAQKSALLQTLLYSDDAGLLDVCFGDETGFTLNPYIPYGWVKQGEDACILAQASKRLNVFGILGTQNQLDTYLCEKNINTQFIIEALDQFSQKLTRTTVLVLDNARTHTSGLFKEQIGKWEKRGLFIFYLPKYSPHLNRIERLWKEIKYQWLSPKDYRCFEDLKNAVKDIIKKFGKEFNIKFQNQKSDD